MSFFDKLKQAAGQFADGASRQAEILKLQNQLGHVETELDRNYGEAGKRCRQLYRAKQILDSEVEVIMKRIDALEGEMEALRQRVQDVQATAEEHGQETPPQTPATPVQQPVPPPGSTPSVATGPAQPGTPPEPHRPPQQTQPADNVLCPSCGKMVPGNALFCAGCGEKLSSDAE